MGKTWNAEIASHVFARYMVRIHNNHVKNTLY